MSNLECDLLVAGVGGIGSATFCAAARRGIDVLGIDPHPAGHDRGSSHGETRMIRGAYFEHPDYVPLALESISRWEALERTTGRRLLHPTGVLEVGFPDGPIIQGILRSAREHGLPLDELDSHAVAARFPQFQVAENQVALFERRAGVLRVEECVETCIAEGVAAGGRFESGRAILAVEPRGQGYQVRTTRETIACRRIAFTAGPWSGGLLDCLRSHLHVRRKHQFWFAVDDTRYHLPAGCPAFYFETAGGHYYGFPALAGGRVKIAEHSGGEPVEDPTAVDRELDSVELARVQRFAAEHLRLAPRAPAGHSVCMYTMSPDEHFIVDQHPDWPGVAMVAGLSGHGFKFAPVLGELLVDLTEGNRDPRLEFLRLERLL